MNTFVVARKELRALFQSPIALLFLSVFLGAGLFLFFTQARFFARGLADARPLFEWMPLLLILLVSAITMRAWAEERRSGTLEVLMTLPVKTWELVLGKYLSGLGLVALGLALTLPIPVTVWTLGPLDWGPVAGGYFAAILLASAYLAIGLCVSARTDNQVVALMVTLVLGLLFWLAGTSTVTSLFSQQVGDILRQVGTGARFESVERGVLDLRDVVYYGSITGFFLVLNAYFLDRERVDGGSESGRLRTAAMQLTLVLLFLNGLLANLWLAPVHRARVDLTDGGEYSVSPVTADTLSKLSEPLKLTGLFSERTHPLLAPIVPQIKDTLTEYAVASGGKVEVQFRDPSADEEFEAELSDRYSVKSVPMGVADTHSQAVVNVFFHVLATYGDKFEVLSLEDLLEVRGDPEGGVQVKLKNLEYDLTRTAKKISQDFVTIDSLVAMLPSQAKLTLYVGGMVPADYDTSIAMFEKVAQRVASIDPARVSYERVDPTPDAALRQKLLDKYGIQEYAADLFGSQRFYLAFVVEIGEEAQRIQVRPEAKDPDVLQSIEAAFRRVTPGQLKKVALVTEVPQAEQNPNLPPQMQLPAPPPDYRYLERLLQENRQVLRSVVDEGFVPEDVDVAIVGKLGGMSPKQQYAVDQFLMRGGTVIALAGAYRVKADEQGIEAVTEDSGLFDLLEAWGVKVDSELVMADQVAPFPLPVQRRLPNGMVLQDIQLLPYPFFPDLRGRLLNEEHPALTGIVGLTMPWSSPVSTTAETLENRTVDWLIHTDTTATTRTDGKIQPDSTDRNGPTWTPGPEAKQRTLALAVSGRFPSFFADKPNPNIENAPAGPDTSGRTLKASVAEGKLVVLGSSELASDLMQALAANTQSEIHAGNLQLLQNLIDWAVEDTDLLSIRTAGAYARVLRPVDAVEATRIQVQTWLLTFVPLGLVIALPWLRRRSVTALPASPVEAA